MITDDTARPPLLAARGLSYARDGERIFGPVDLAVDVGQTWVVEGANGSGKSTLLRLLAGLLRVEDGSIHWRGEPLAHPRGLALLGHQLGLKLELSALENLRYRIAVDGLRPGIALRDALRSVGLDGYEDLPLRALSAGQRKRAALAALLLADAQLWLLDEPYANLDADGQRLVDRMLESHAQRGGAAVVATHLVRPSTASHAGTLKLRGAAA